jgi:hypothetical protein
MGSGRTSKNPLVALQRFSNCRKAKAGQLSGFFIDRGPHGWVLVRGVEEKATLLDNQNAKHELENSSKQRRQLPF